MLTKRMKDCLDFIDRYMKKSDGIAPSYDEIKKGIGLKSKSGVYRYIEALEERGFIKRIPYRARAVEILKRPQ